MKENLKSRVVTGGGKLIFTQLKNIKRWMSARKYKSKPVSYRKSYTVALGKCILDSFYLTNPVSKKESRYHNYTLSKKKKKQLSLGQ